jgi:endonuclease/exonuclease/phosphatase family metal-dependent hydrolase
LGDVTCLWWNADNLFGAEEAPRPSRRVSHYATYADGLAAICEVLAGAPDGVPDIICLGEVGVVAGDAPGLRALQQALERAGAQRSVRWGDTAGDPLVTCGVLWNERTVRLCAGPISHPVKVAWHGDAVGRPILELQFEEVTSGRAFTVYVNHWTSRRTDTVGGSRLEASEKLLELVRYGMGQAADVAIVVLGDFNEEPFDAPMRNPLRPRGNWHEDLIVRDRLALLDSDRRADRPVLYNPCWRLMGELDDPRPPTALSQAGTYYYELVQGDRVVRRGWYTFDQVLVNAEMLRGERPLFVEESLTVLRPSAACGKDGRPEGPSDHFPLWFKLRFPDRDEEEQTR